MNYIPMNYENISINNAFVSPNTTKAYNNKSFHYWQRSLFQRATSVFNIKLPKDWEEYKDLFNYCLFRFGYVAVADFPEYGVMFQPCTLSGRGFMYQPTNALIANHALKRSLNLKIDKECSIIKLTPDYMGIFDIVNRYAEQLSNLDNAINISLINSKYGFMVGAKSKSAAEALKKMFDKINRGEPAVFYDNTILDDDRRSDSPFQLLDRDLAKNYLTTSQLDDLNTILSKFDNEIGIPTLPYNKKERLVTSEAESKIIDSTSRSIVWLDCLKTSIENTTKLFPEIRIEVELRYNIEDKENVTDGYNEQSNID